MHDHNTNIFLIQNHPVERFWVEINGRVNYPVKASLIKMEEQGVIDMESSMHKFCVSWFAIREFAVLELSLQFKHGMNIQFQVTV